MGWYEALLTCSLRPASGPVEKGRCAWCGAELGPGRRRWCSNECPAEWGRQHWWTTARRICLDAAQDETGIPRCVHCHTGVASEVNHIEPRNGAGYDAGCWNHQENLEALCHACHVVVTTGQQRARLGIPPEGRPAPSRWDREAEPIRLELGP